MARLNPEQAEKVAAAEDGFKPLEPGIYRLQLVDDVDERQGEKGKYWRWEFVVADLDRDGNEQANAKRKLWTNTSLSDAAFFKLKEAFAAFGVDTNTDTEDLIGKFVRAQIKQVTIQKGARQGELSNEIVKLLPDDGPIGPDGEVSDAPATGAAPSAVSVKKDEPLF